MDRDEWFRRYYEDVILMNNSDKEVSMQNHQKTYNK